MKILEICPFSEGIDGVFTRVREEALLLSERGHEVRIFSSDIVKGRYTKAKQIGKIKDVMIIRFPSNQNLFDKLVSENVTYFDFDKEFEKFKPDLVITHLLHPHSFKALRLCKKYNKKCYLVPHAPFAVKRKFILDLATKAYYRIKIKNKITEFDKVIAITNWEKPYLKELGLSDDKIYYIPNGIPEEFFKQKKEPEKNKILFLGRVAPVKDIETLIRAIRLIKTDKITLEIVGPAEKDYLLGLKRLIKNLKIEKRIMFSPPIYNIKDKIKKIDSARIFVLPSKREAMPQALIEAMARAKVIIASDNLGTRDLIKNGKNGYLFKVGNSHELAGKIDMVLSQNNKKLGREAKKSVQQFSWNKIIKKLKI